MYTYGNLLGEVAGIPVTPLPSGAHYVALEYDGANNQYIDYNNVHSNYNDFSDMMNQDQATSMVVMGIDK